MVVSASASIVVVSTTSSVVVVAATISVVIIVTISATIVVERLCDAQLAVVTTVDASVIAASIVVVIAIVITHLKILKEGVDQPTELYECGCKQWHTQDAEVTGFRYCVYHINVHSQAYF